MELQEIIDSYINGNKYDFYTQVKEYDVYIFFDRVRSYFNENYLPYTDMVSMFMDYLYYDSLEK